MKFSIDRAVASKNTNLAPEINNVGSVDVVDPVTVKITMKTPTIGSFFELLAGRETMPVSPTAVTADPTGFNTKPVGAGPFTVTEYTPQSIMSLRKNPTYWDAKNWKLGGIDFIQATAGAPRINAFSGGQADMAELDSSQTEDLKGVAGAKVEAAASDANFLYLATCKNKPPFDNLQFREAVQMTMDRDAINQVLLNGAGQPMVTMWPEQSTYFTKSLENSFAYNVKKAKKLFQQAGWNSNDTLPIGYTLASPQLKTFAEIFQSQMGDAGVKVELVPMTDIVTQFYTNVQTPAAISLWIRPGLQKVTRGVRPEQRGERLSVQRPEPQLVDRADRGAATGQQAAEEALGPGERERHRQPALELRCLAADRGGVEHEAGRRRRADLAAAAGPRLQHHLHQEVARGQ